MLLPEPVGATDSTSRPASWASTTSAWPGRNSWYLKTPRRTSTGVGTALKCGRVGDRGASFFTARAGRSCDPLAMQAGVAEFVLAMMAASAVALLARSIPICYESALALVGLAAGVLVGPIATGFAHSLILFVLLPGLLFEASYRLSWRQLRGNLLAVVLLATVGVVLTTAVVAFLGHVALGL